MSDERVWLSTPEGSAVYENLEVMRAASNPALPPVPEEDAADE